MERRLTSGLTEMTRKKQHTPRATTNKRSAAQREGDLVAVARLLREGFTHREIAEWIRLNRPYKLSRTQVAYDCAELTRNWRASAREAIEDRVARQLAEIDAACAENWKAWEKSIGEVTEVVQERVETDKESVRSRRRVVIRKWTSHADPRYIRNILDCVEARNRLLGLTKHRLEVAGLDGGSLEVDTNKGHFDMEHIEGFLKREYAELVEKSQPEATNDCDV